MFNHRPSSNPPAPPASAGSTSKKNCCSKFLLYFAVVAALFLCLMNFLLTLYYHQEIRQRLDTEMKKIQATIADEVELRQKLNSDLRNVQATLHDQVQSRKALEQSWLETKHNMEVHKADYYDSRETETESLKRKSIQLEPESKEMQLIREMKDSFSLAIRELNGKVSWFTFQRNNGGLKACSSCTAAC